jgi:hypothetical protein
MVRNLRVFGGYAMTKQQLAKRRRLAVVQICTEMAAKEPVVQPVVEVEK